jgi:hypothetical protein
MDSESLLIISRSLERLLIVVFAGASLWMGWQLFLRVANTTDQQAEFSYKDMVVRLQRVGPGVFFALFGAVVLSISLSNSLVVSNPSGGQGQDEADQDQDGPRTAADPSISIWAPDPSRTWSAGSQH